MITKKRRWRGKVFSMDKAEGEKEKMCWSTGQHAIAAVLEVNLIEVVDILTA